MRRILVLQHSPGGFLGSLQPPLRDAGFALHTWKTFEEPAPPLHAGEIDALIGLGGVMHPDEDVAHPWLPEVRALYQQSVRRGVPVLGVCLGMQLMAQALGGSAGPLGRLRVGFLPVEFQAGDDPLFGDLPASFDVHATHLQSVLTLPEDATVLATSDKDDCQAFRWRKHVWGVQFHPEFSTVHMREYIHVRRMALLREGANPQAMRKAVGAAPHARQVLKRFVHQARKRG